jgi:hypothetical protein
MQMERITNANTPSGTYTVYTKSEVGATPTSPGNCDTASVTCGGK